jgi:hypothetical protein
VGLLDRLLGRTERDRPSWDGGQQTARPAQRPAAGRSEDEVAIERYRYLLRTAPPEQVEQAHAEAFAKLTPEQRRQVLAELSAEVPPGERAQSDDPRSLARMATRAEMRQPGTMERALGRGGMGGMGMGGMIAGGLLASVAGAFVGTAIADAMFDFNDSGESTDSAADGGDAGGTADTAADTGDYGGDYGGGGDFGGGDFGGGDFGGDMGGF